MAIPGYMYLTDNAGKKIQGSVTIKGREGSVEVISYDHEIFVPTDGNTGKLTGKRVHQPFIFLKEKDRSSTELQKAMSSGKTLQEVTLQEYAVNSAGQEEIYHTIVMTNVKIVRVKATMQNIKDPLFEKFNHMETVELRYEAIKWTFVDGHHEYEDTWNERGDKAA
ncbi:type VI secretion system tube protein TssD [Pandoraea norimbergensis]|uniref:Hcp family T6SS protein CtsH1 n=1 Tax=Pandoraea norimbergensis TaxID=93219 RepID=A0ABM5WQK3_9BURK|nr:type VI secretion system tube protein TssD [Pandoraea norimbergensis]ALS62887.1 Hcp family T6SS protein CtsH1 [Pandoraea norimbergensis]